MPEAFRRPARFRNADEEKLRGFAPKVYSFLAGALAEIAIGAVRPRGKTPFLPREGSAAMGIPAGTEGRPFFGCPIPLQMLKDIQQDFAAREPNPFL
ncbi:MAG: hypothetical protein C6W56_01015 [Caldibacillus debilis]|nr:hypothetical protein [Bacillaceae bacterium]OUM84070.1 MAG: hypothetical protein BAA03_07095 [Caldibacillus debilis]REJ30939.1 MAG: hypothetical protein C6W56_01015 [Caldibacillus debilis]